MQESVREYPRPPRLEASRRHVQVVLEGIVIAESRRAQRVLETGQAPAFYLPPEDVRLEYLEPAAHTTWCEWKGAASYYDAVVGDRRVERAAWFYPQPMPEFAPIADHVAFYPQVLECLLDGERARPMPGGFYGGWVTREIVGLHA